MFQIIPFELESAYAITWLLDSCMWGWSMDVSEIWMPASKNGQIEIFCNFFGVVFLKLVCFIQLLITFVKNYISSQNLI